ncbi:NUDIX hydrolase [Actinoallomurus sp. CA-150999]|uniref:NUDIX hydrolase n=1 Tax=Actinoallomurus sp. CA-150999 TaxID=3239887 RepID=UPI003D932E34
MSDLPRHSVAVAGIVIDDCGRALLVRRRDNGRWEPPGGVLELDETITDGLRREVKEESGLTVEPEALTGVYKNIAHGIVALTFRCRALGGQLTTNPEADAFRWVSPDEVAALTTEVFAYRVLDAYRASAAPAIRTHNGVTLLRPEEARTRTFTVGEKHGYPASLPRHSVSAGAAVVREDGRILAIKRADNGAWVQPGGIVELDEDPRDAVRREVLEETGVHVEPEVLTGVYKNMKRGIVSLVFRCRPLSGEPHPTEEAAAVAWLDRDAVTGRMAEAFAVRLLDALDRGWPYVRIHDGERVLG